MRPLVIAALAFAVASAQAQTPQKSATDCGVSLGKYMNLTFDEFDQSPAGWREIADKPGCERAAADLIAKYRDEKISQQVAGLDWHEGQVRAAAGQTAKALDLFRRNVAFEKSAPAEQRSEADILYGEASIAFLEGDRKTLEARRAELAALPMPDGMAEALVKFKEKYPGQSAPEWPLNLGVVDGLIRCFGKPYAEAYACRGGNASSERGVQ